MPLYDGNLASLVHSKERQQWSNDELCTMMLEQMLGALDYLASERTCHRDVKPENILYSWDPPGQLRFRLADFGLAIHHTLATSACGTSVYRAPEQNSSSHGRLTLDPKVDVWSLFATLASAHHAHSFPPPKGVTCPETIVALLCAIAQEMPHLAPMARTDPKLRASAAQMLVACFDGRGLTTPRAVVPPIPSLPDAPAPEPALSGAPAPPEPLASAPEPVLPAIQVPTEDALIQYPRKPPQRVQAMRVVRKKKVALLKARFTQRAEGGALEPIEEMDWEPS